MESYRRYAPLNFVSTVPGGEVAGLDCKRFYTVPRYDASLAIDATTHDAFMRAASLSASDQSFSLKAALQDLNLHVPDVEYDNGKRLSQARFRTLFTELCGVCVLRRPLFGYRVVCLCPDFWSLTGQCVHEVFVRYLEGDREAQLAPLVAMTRGQGVQSAAESAATGRDAHRAVESRGQPWSTLAQIKAAAQARAKARAARVSAQKVKVLQMFGSPPLSFHLLTISEGRKKPLKANRGNKFGKQINK